MESFLPKSGFFNLIFLTLSIKLEAIFVAFSWVVIFWLSASTSFVGTTFCSTISVGLVVLTSVTVVCWEVEVSWVVEVCSKFFCSFSFSFCAWISSNHFSKIGIASSKFGVPDDEIFCFPSI